MESNREKSNIAIAILEKLSFLKGEQKLFRILMVAIIFSSTVQNLFLSIHTAHIVIICTTYFPYLIMTPPLFDLPLSKPYKSVSLP